MTRAAPLPTPLPARPSAIELLDEVTKRPPSERPAYLELRCGGDTALQSEVESLLSHLDAAPEFLRRMPFEGPGDAPPGAGPLAPGTRILRYRIERVVGEGGMGVVYLARQEHPDRAVALKLIRPIAATPAMIRRFAREAEMLGRLQHPGIAQIFEAGTADLGGGVGQPFLAMEFVEGVPLTEFARARGLGLPDRLELAGRLCEAVEHAHQRGLIHRDLKPANILVTDKGDPKILDFGVARATDGMAPGATMATEVGVLIGTLAYMSPEQVAGGAAGGLDTRSDIYSLGVVLYELVCGRLPHDTAGLGLFEAAKAIREREPTRPGALDRSLRGDIETIVLMAMAKERERRYASAGALREDIRRCLAGEPIAARQDSALYVLRKQLRRYRWGVVAAVLFVALLAGFGLWAAAQARAYRRVAGSEAAARQRISAQEREAVEQLRVSNLERGRMLALGGDMRGAERAMWSAFAAKPGAPDTTWALRELYLRFPLRGTLAAGDVDLFTARFSPDGRLLATAGDRGEVHVWNPTTGALVRTIRGHTKRLNCVRFSPDGTLLASGGLDSVIRLWNVSDGSPAGELVGHRLSMHEFVFTRDGRRLYSSGQDGTLKVWDVAARAMIHEVHAAANGWAVRLDEARGRVMSSDFAGMIHVRDADTLELVHEFTAHTGTAHCLALSPDGSVLASGGGRDGTIALWNAADWALVRRASVNAGSIRAVTFSPDGTVLIVTGSKATIALSTGTLEPVASGLPELRGGWGADVRADGRLLVTTSTGPGAARLWSVGPYAGKSSVKAHSGNVVTVAVNADGSRFASGAADGSFVLWSGVTGAELKRWIARSPVRAIAFSPDGLWLASAHASGTIRINAIDDGLAELINCRGHSASAGALAYLPDGRLVSGADDGTIRIWDAPASRELGVIPAGSPADGLALSDDGRWIAANTRDRVAMVWDARTLEPVGNGMERPGSLFRTLVFSPDADRLFIPTVPGPIEVWGRARDAPAEPLNGHTRYVVRAVVGTDRATLASIGQDGLLNFWELSSGRCLASFPIDEPTVHDMVWWPGSLRFTLGCGEGRLVHVDLEPLSGFIVSNAWGQAQAVAADPGAAERAARIEEWLDRDTTPGAPPRAD